jgi:hypothetical protein
MNEPTDRTPMAYALYQFYLRTSAFLESYAEDAEQDDPSPIDWAAVITKDAENLMVHGPRAYLDNLARRYDEEIRRSLDVELIRILVEEC